MLGVLVGAILFSVACASTYTVTATRLSQVPIFSSQSNDSVFTYNYNAGQLVDLLTLTFSAAVLPGSSTATRGLLVRCQNAAAGNAGPSVIAYTRQLNQTSFERIGEENVILAPIGPEDDFGVEDPRVVFDPVVRKKSRVPHLLSLSFQSKDYILLYSAVQSEPTVISRLAMARSPTPTVKSSWKRMGPLFPVCRPLPQFWHGARF